MKTLLQVFESIKKKSQKTEFIPTGIKNFDDFLDGGFMRKELIVLGGYTGTGKSYLSGQIFLNAVREAYKCAYFSLEISNEMVVTRLIGSEANLKPTWISAGLLKADQHKAKVEAQSKLMAYDGLMAFYDDVYQLDKIEAEIRANNYDLVVVDFIQNVLEKGDEYEKLSKIALNFQKLAKEKDCVILTVSQLSNEAHKSGSLEYKGSGSIATVCDLGLFITRDEDKHDLVTLKVRKNRRGVSGVNFLLQSLEPGGKLVYVGGKND